MEEKKYCPDCKHLNVSETEKCAFCGKDLIAVSDNDYVFLTSADHEAFGYIKEELGKRGIEYISKDKSLPPDGSVYSGKGFVADKDIYVEYKDYPMAEDALNEAFSEVAKSEEMPKGKRIIVQIISVLAFIVLIYIAVRGADTAAELFKSLFR